MCLQNHDMFNYGRFDLIDTSDTDSDCSNLFDYHRVQAPGICKWLVYLIIYYVK